VTGDEIKVRNISVMGNDLGTQYTALFREFTTLYLYWKEFLELFGTNDKRIDRLNRAAPGFFRMLKEQQFETNMLHLARLTDSPKSVGKLNLTVCNLPDLVTDHGLKTELTSLLAAVKDKTEFCRDWRNRRFAHNDLMLAMQDGRATPLSPATRDRFNEALQAVSDLLNTVERFYFNNSCSFEDVVPHHGAGRLLSILGFGVREQERMQDKIRRNDFTAIDMPETV
jgi:hypothetical protein